MTPWARTTAIFLAGSLGLLAASGVFAFHRESGFIYLANGDRSVCTGPSCWANATFIDLIDPARFRYLTLRATIFLNTLLVPSSIRDTTPASNPPPFDGRTAGRFRGTIVAAGEISGYAATLFDSPPITFHPASASECAGRVTAPYTGCIKGETTRLISCDLLTLLDQTGSKKARCRIPDPATTPGGIPPMYGMYRDTAPVYKVTGPTTRQLTPRITCAVAASGTEVTCDWQAGTEDGVYEVEVRREVNNLTWRGRRVVAFDPPPLGPQFFGRPPTPMTMVTTARVPFGLVPNLTVSNVSWTPAAPLIGRRVTFTATVFNSGSAEAGPTQTRLQVDTGADRSFDTGPVDRATPAILPRGTQTVRWDDVWTAGPKSNIVQVCADATNAVNELYESDNCVPAQVFVDAPPEVTVTAPATAQVGQAYAATARVTDVGGNMVYFAMYQADPTTCPPETLAAFPDQPPACAQVKRGPFILPIGFANYSSTLRVTPTQNGDSLVYAAARDTNYPAYPEVYGKARTRVGNPPSPTPPPPLGVPRGVLRELPP